MAQPILTTALASLAVLLLASQLPRNASTLNALRAAHADKPLKSPVAVFVGGTAGIGAALAVKTAKYSVNPDIHIVGRNRASAEKVLAELRAANPDGTYHFHESDVSLLSNARTLAITLSRQLSKINLLVLTAGILSFNGRTETSEGHDVKMVLHYYSRMLFIDALLPNLQAAAVGTGGEGNARVMSVLNSMEGDCRKLLWDDLDLKNSYTPGNAKVHSISMTDVALQRFARLHPSISFQHSYPSLVLTGLYGGLPWYASGPVNFLGKLFGTTPEDCAECLFDPLWNDSTRAGAHFADSRGKEVKGKVESSEGVQEKIWAHTRSIISKP